MTAVLTKNLWHSMPGWGIVANLLPPELLEARRAHALRRLVAFGAVGVVVLAIIGYGFAAWRGHSASNALSRAQDTTHSLTAEQGKYNEVVQIQGSLAQVQSQISTLMADDVQFSGVVGSLRSDLLPGMAISQLSAQVDTGTTGTSTAGSSGTGANSGAVLNTSPDKTIGTMTMTGTAIRFSDVSAYIDKLSAVTGLVQVYPISNAAGTAGVQFSLQITLTDKLLSHRYDTAAKGPK
ncbi:MAG: hypothetical protein ACRDRL_32415 [Sciscionella sp.]